MAQWTAAEVRHAALEHLGIVGAGQAATAEDDDLAERRYVPLYANLRRKNLAPFARNAVDDWAWDSLPKLLAWKMVGAFGFTGARRQSLKDDRDEAMKELQSGAALQQTGRKARGQFF
jgi:hypothetical protein